MPDYTPPASGGGGGAPSGSAGGDLGGTYPNPTVSSNMAAVDSYPANPLVLATAGNALYGIAALKPEFYPIVPPPGVRRHSVSALACFVQTLLASSTAGAAIYSISYSAAQTFAATLVGALTSTIDCSTTGRKQTDFASGPLALDYTTTLYWLGFNASSAATLKFFGQSGNSSAQTVPGGCRWSNTVRANANDWPSSFTQADVASTPNASDLWVACHLLTTAGKNWM